jgi:hypothetical protein
MLHVPEKPFEVKLFRHKFNSQEKSKYLLIKKLHIEMVKLVFNLFLINCSRNMVQLTIEQRVFVVLHYTKGLFIWAEVIPVSEKTFRQVYERDLALLRK